MTSPRQHTVGLVAAYDRPDAGTAEALCDTHPADAIAFTVVEPDLTSHDHTFGELRDRSARLATALAALGVGRGDRVATLMGKSAELVVSVLAVWRLGAVHVPLFTAFGPGAIAVRLTGTKVVLTEPGQLAKLRPSAELPADPGRRIVSTGVGSGSGEVFELRELLTAPPQADPERVGGDGTIIELFTSGTTGAPKGVPVPLRALAAIRSYQEYGLDHSGSDVFWNAADPGWAYGLYHAVLGPMTLGRRSLLVRGGFSPEQTYSVLGGFGVTNFTAGPTVYRALRNSGVPAPADLALRHCSSAGEPLGADVVAWAEQELGVPIRDHYGQTELGMVVAAAWHPGLRTDVPAGSMGRELPGWRLDVLRPDADEIAPPGEPGRLAVDLAASPLMWFTGYRDAPARTAERFTADRRWYLTGDTASKDAAGYFRFGSRDDDVILMAGYRIGPAEVESVLQHHDKVAEAAVVGVPDEIRGEVLVAYVVPRTGVEADENLGEELRLLVKTRLAAHVYPREVHFVESLPKTPSGKLQRFVLRRERERLRNGSS
ncbi:AMP-binding protein [Amycolatopsis lurida]